jgi:tight adherence protein C
MSWILIIPAAVFGMIVLIGLAVSYSLSKPDLQRRLEALRADSILPMEERLKLPFLDRVFLPMLDTFGRKMKRFEKQDRMDKLQAKLVQAGVFPRYTASRFSGLRLFCSLGLFVGVTVFQLLMGVLGSVAAGKGLSMNVSQTFDTTAMLICLGAFALGYFGPTVWLNKRTRLRQEAILRALPSAIDLISIGAEAGMGFDQAMNYVRRQTSGALAEEFGTTLNEVRLGKARIEALNNLAYRTGVDDLKIFVGAVTQSFQLGTSIVDTLRIQADSIRVKQRQRAQEQAMKVPVKMMFPLVFLIFPALLLVILGPALVTIFKSGL